jgi:hypothetical protein
MYNEEKQLLDQAVFGEQIKEFLLSDLGQFILHKGEQERDAALSQLSIVDPTDVKAITKLQNDIQVIEHIKYWLSEAIQEGLQAANVLDAHKENYE